MTGKEMVEKFLCPGCVVGSDTNCGKYIAARDRADYDGCESHCLGTQIMPYVGLIALGMPKGFNRPGFYYDERDKPRQPHHMPILLFPKGANRGLLAFDWLNVPVWALEQDGFLFIRVLVPRIGVLYTYVVEEGRASELCPQAINVTDRYDEYS